MKQKLYHLGVITAILLTTGTIFKMEHWPAAGIMIISGTLILILLFFPAALVNSFKAEGNRQNRLLYIVTGITCFVVFLGMLFKLMHWPYAGIALLIALPFPYVVFLPIFLVVTSRNKNYNIYNTVFVLILLALNSVFSGLLAINVAKETIIDSYNISQDYSRAEVALTALPINGETSPINMKIDEIIKITNDYQDLILKHEGMTREQWKKNPDDLLRADSPNIAAEVLTKNGEVTPGMKLHKALTELVILMKQTKGYEKTAKALPEITGLGEEAGEEPVETFSGTNIIINLSWVLTYLNGLESNLSMIKASQPDLH